MVSFGRNSCRESALRLLSSIITEYWRGEDLLHSEQSWFCSFVGRFLLLLFGVFFVRVGFRTSGLTHFVHSYSGIAAPPIFSNATSPRKKSSPSTRKKPALKRSSGKNLPLKRQRRQFLSTPTSATPHQADQACIVGPVYSGKNVIRRLGERVLSSR